MDTDQFFDTNGSSNQKSHIIFRHKFDNLTLKDSLIHLRGKFDDARALKSDGDSLKEFYRNEFLPHMLQLRRLNRIEKDRLYNKNERIKDLNLKIMNLQQQYDCLSFEASCQLYRVGGGDLPKKVTIEDHVTRMQSLDEEELKRKEFEEKLIQLSEETVSIEQACSENSQKLAQVKPYVKQLVERVVPLLNQ